MDALAIPHVVNPRIVRGLDYYTHTVFEWTTTALGAQGTVCGGGRYDGLVEQLGGRPTPGIGVYAMGLERLTMLVESLGRAMAEAVPWMSTCWPWMKRTAQKRSRSGSAFVKRFRRSRCRCIAVGGKAKARFKKADASGARYALILGEREIAEGTVAVKPHREVEAGQTMPKTLAALVDESVAQGVRFAEQYGRIDKEIGAVTDVESDEELVELIQRSWERYGVSLVVGVVLAARRRAGLAQLRGP